jgi:cobalt-precorrin 5A hydrolase
MNLALITLSRQGLWLAQQLAETFPTAQIFARSSVPDADVNDVELSRFDSVVRLSQNIFSRFRGLVYLMPAGVVVRAIAGCLQNKWVDPAVVVVDIGGRHAISLLSGHEGGANQLAIQVANRLGAEPVISTSIEATKPLVVGVGCRRNTPENTIVEAICHALEKVGLDLANVRCLASADVKKDEVGLAKAARHLNLPLCFVSSRRIRAYAGAFQNSSFVQASVGLPGVAEPAAMLCAHQPKLVLEKTICNATTVAIARENLAWSA